jgi:hypothetical protein
MNESVVDLEGLLNERTNGVLHPSIHSGGILSANYLRPAESVVLCNVDKLGSVRFTSLVYSVPASAFVATEMVGGGMDGQMLLNVPKRRASVALLVLHLLFQRKSHGFGAHVKHFIYFVVDTMVLETKHLNEQYRL